MPTLFSVKPSSLRTLLFSISIIFLLVMLGGLFIGTTHILASTGILYVNAANNSGIEDGTLEHPYRTITSALEYVASGETILVYPGTYQENLYLYNFEEPTKQITLKSLSGPSVTIIDGRNLESVITLYNGQLTVEGFTIQNGGGSFGLASAGFGIVIYPYTDARAIIRNNIIKNTRLRAGIGLSTSNIGSHLEALIENNYLTFNTGSDPFQAGGINIDFSTAPSGWAIIRNNVIAHNQSFTGGVRVCCWTTGFQADLINNTIISNTGTYGGGIALNAASARLANNIIAMNVASTAGNDMYVVQSGALATLEYNDIGDGQYAGLNHNISTPPLLSNPAAGNYHLTANSPLINAGTNVGAPVIDFEGDPRPYGLKTDIGADEFVWAPDSTAPTSSATSPHVADISFSVSWQGSDSNGSGIEYYDTQVKDGSLGAWNNWLTRTLSLQATYTGTIGHTYYFQSRAIDHAGNIESYPGGNGDTTTFIGPDLASSIKRVVAQPGDLTAGSILTYTILIHNTGYADAAARITDTLPAFTRYITDSLNASVPMANFEANLGQNGSILWYGSASLSEPVTLTFEVELLSANPADLTIRNTVQIDDGWGHIVERVTFTPSHDIYLPLVRR